MNETENINVLPCERNMSHTELIDEELFHFPLLAMICKPKERLNMADIQRPRE
jgi:hypothetical protein